MSYNFNLEGMMEHRVQTDVIFKLKVLDGSGQPADAQLRVEASLKGQKDTVRGEVSYSPGTYSMKFFPWLSWILRAQCRHQWPHSVFRPGRNCSDC